MLAKRTLLVLMALILALPWVSGTAMAQMRLQNGVEVKGALTGSPSGAFAQYELEYPGNDAKLEIELSLWPPNPLTGCGLGLRVYGWNGFEGRGVPSGDKEGLLEFSYQAKEPTTFLVQVECYGDGGAFTYRLTATGVAAPAAAPAARIAAPPPAVYDALSGTTLGNSGGGIRLHNMGYPGHGEDAKVTMTFWPSDPSYDAAIGFLVYDPQGRLVATGQPTDQVGERVATVSAERGGEYAIQVFNYAQDVDISYKLGVAAAANGDHYVDIGGRRLHAVLDGAGGPTIVLESGMGQPLSTWAKVAPEIVKMGRTLAYDRGFVGASDPGPEPRNSWQLATELHTLLHNLRLAPPYVLVGHSSGGFTVRMFAHLYPSEVAGMVLIDATPEDHDMVISKTRTPEEWAAYQANYAKMMAAPSPGVALEFAAKPQNIEMMHQIKLPTNVPIISLVATMVSPTATARDRADKQAAIDLRADWLKQAPQIKQVFAPKSGHFIQNDQPDLVIQAVRDVVAQVSK